jgi:hypothetical protein
MATILNRTLQTLAALGMILFLAFPGLALAQDSAAPAPKPEGVANPGAQTVKKRKRMVTVLPLKPLDVPVDEASLVELQFRKELAALKQIAVQSKSETELYLEQARQVDQYCDTAQQDCLVRLGNLVGVTKLIHGALSPQGKNNGGGLVLQVSLIDVPAQVKERQAREVIPPDGQGRQGALKRLAVKLLAPHEALGRLSVLVKPAGAQIYVDGMQVGTAPLDAPLRNLNAGRHRVQVFSPPLAPFDGFVEVKSGKTAKLEIRPQGDALMEHQGQAAAIQVVEMDAGSAPKGPSGLGPTLMGIGGVTAALGLATAGGGGLVYFLNRAYFEPTQELIDAEGQGAVLARAEDTRTTMGALFGVGATLAVVGAGIATAGLLVE